MYSAGWLHWVWKRNGNRPRRPAECLSRGRKWEFADVPKRPYSSARTTLPSRIYRFTNIRANANPLAVSGVFPAPVTATVSGLPTATGGSLGPFTVGTVQPGIIVQPANTGFFGWCPNANGGQILTINPDGSTAPATFGATMKEGFPQAFKTQGTNTPSTVGVPSTTESGFVLGPSVGNGLGSLAYTPGLADYGTRIRAAFTSIPSGVNLFVSVNGNLQDPNNKTAGSYSVTSATGTVSGSNITASPDSNGNIVFDFSITARDPTNPNPLSFTPTFTVAGTPSGLPNPLQFVMSAGFMGSLYPYPTLFTPTSPSAPPLPAFQSYVIQVANFQYAHGYAALSDIGLRNLWSGYLATEIGNCSSSSTFSPFAIPHKDILIGSLNTADTSTPAFVEVVGTGTGTSAGPSLIAPATEYLGIVSLANIATTNVTVAANPPAPWLNVSLSATTTPLTVTLTANKAAIGNYSTTLNFGAPGGLSLAVPVTYAVTNGPWFTQYGFANSASYVSNVVAPGEPFVIFGGDAFGPAALAGPALNSNGLVATTIGNTQVLFDGTPAPLYYSVNANGLGQIAGFAPFELAGKTSTNVQVVYNGVTSPGITLNVLDAVPGLYTADSSGGGQGAFLNQDLTVNSSSNPAAVGSLVVLYGGGAGQTAPVGRDGGLAGVGAPLATLTLPVKVFIDGIQATSVQYAGPAPGLVEGVFQINVTIPAGVRSGTNVPVIVQVEDKQTQLGVTLATK